MGDQIVSINGATSAQDSSHIRLETARWEEKKPVHKREVHPRNLLKVFLGESG